MRNKLKILLVALALILLPLLASADVLYVAGSSVKFAWDDEQTDIESYSVVLVRSTGEVYGPYDTITKVIEVARPRSGIYEVRVRANRQGLSSEWHSSIDENAMLKTGVQGKWKVYFKLLGPVGPIIIY